MNEKEIAKMMKLLDISRDEAIEVLKDDDAIDHGEKLFELTAEQKKVEKQMKNTGIKTVNAVDAYGKKKTRTLKEDTDKTAIMLAIKETLNSLSVNDLNQTKTGQYDFKFNNRKFRIVVSAPRK